MAACGTQISSYITDEGDHGMDHNRLDSLQKWAQIVTAAAAIIALIVTLLVAYKTIRLTSDLAYDYQGAQVCHDYRTEVYELSEDKHVAPAAIEKIMSMELARDERYANAYQVQAEGCGSVEDILGSLSQKVRG